MRTHAAHHGVQKAPASAPARRLPAGPKPAPGLPPPPAAAGGHTLADCLLKNAPADRPAAPLSSPIQRRLAGSRRGEMQAAVQRQRETLHQRKRRVAAAAGAGKFQAAVAGGQTLPSSLRSGMEALSGLDLSGVRVHRNSAQPARVQALAFAQGEHIHMGPGQEGHLAHEAWHVVQQKQGRVRPETQLMPGVPLNDDSGLEREADTMGAKALQAPAGSSAPASGRGGREVAR